LIRRSKHRLGKIEHRLEILAGYLICFLNLDEVIKIIRNEDEPKPVLMKKFKLSDVQAEAILNMRLRSLRKLEEIEIKKEDKALREERKQLKELLADEKLQWQAINTQIGELKEKFGAKTSLGKRRTELGKPPVAIAVPVDAHIERESVTILCSEKGWIKTISGHKEDVSDTKYKEGDKERFVMHAETTDKLLVFATNGRFYTIGVDKLPRGRGYGEPLSLMVDFGGAADVVALFKYEESKKLLVASDSGHGFIVEESEILAQTKNGKQVLNLGEGAEAKTACIAEGDHVAVIGTNRKMIIFPIDELPTMNRGKGVALQKYKDGDLSDITVFNLKDGLSWTTKGGKVFNEPKIKDWIGKRAQAGRLAPSGFPRNNKFS
jgi:topoisomerase-4 subunit A